MKKIIISLIVLCLSFTMNLVAQSVSGGFKVGANFSKISGPSEMFDGKASETNSFDNGFHIAAIVNFRLSEVLGLRTELMYSQKGTDYTFEGPSYWFFYPDVDHSIFVETGSKKTRLFVSNSYFEIPVLVFGRIGKFELSGGASVGFLVGSKATGEIKYSAPTIDPFTVGLDFNYNKDLPMRELQSNQPSQMVQSSGVSIPVPTTVGAFYEALGQTDKRYAGLDVGLNAGVSYFLNKGLFVGLRVNYGLLDVTINEQDFSASNYNSADKTFIQRDDVDKNITFQLSIGFSM